LESANLCGVDEIDFLSIVAMVTDIHRDALVDDPRLFSIQPPGGSVWSLVAEYGVELVALES
jgi:hypothetical protein